MQARYWILFAVASLTSSVALAGPYEDALDAYDRADYTTALRLYRTAADQGHPQAQISLGMMYAFGRGAQRNAGEAVRWYRLAAAQGEVHAHTQRISAKTTISWGMTKGCRAGDEEQEGVICRLRAFNGGCVVDDLDGSLQGGPPRV